MTITKKLLRQEIENCKIVIEGLQNEIEMNPFMDSHNSKTILRMKGQIEAYTNLLN